MLPLNYFYNLTPELIRRLEKLVTIESPSQDKQGVDRVGEVIADACCDLGAEVERVTNAQAGDHLIARFQPEPVPGLKTEKPILLLHHMDTVFPIGTLEKMPFYEKGEKIYGPGVLDMKGGIVVSIAAIKALKDNGHLKRPIIFLATSDEETGSHTSRELIEALAKEAALVLVLEPGLPDGALKTWRKGVGIYQVRVKGRAAHAGGAHEEGRNAIEEMAHQVLAIQKMTDYTKGTTLNVGVIAGGTVSNVVPEEAVAEVDFRVKLPEEAMRVESMIKGLRQVTPDTTVEVSGGLNRPPMPDDDLMKTTFEKARLIGAQLGLDIRAGGSGGGSDGNFVSPLKIPLLDGLGPYGEGFHSEREYIVAHSLPERTALMAALISEWTTP